jgi:UDP-N-acetylmuramyl pentapeptide phosphotransferase/UDP-N-acetylglucosamine-1-phosphate transferase
MADDIGTLGALSAAITVVVAAATSAALIVMLQPWLKRYALAKPNARSSHQTPTPQGGGIAVVAAMFVALGVALFILGATAPSPLLAITAAAAAMAGLGAVDDIHPLPVVPRLLLQAVVVAAVIYALPDARRIVAVLPAWVEWPLLLLGGLWFVNLVNFMDGIDWMTVAEVLPLTAALAVLGLLHALPAYATMLALALGGATAGFAYFNRPTAKIFLGDVGSLPIGVILGALLLLVADGGHLIAALILPLYYLADATLTLARRSVAGEPVWQAHRTHFYQRATDRGFTTLAVVGRVFAVNVGLGALAILTVAAPGRTSNIVALAGGALLVAWLLSALARGRT